ncbi:MAG: peptide chain release factor 1 [Planctomycetes bacterium]|nr:peptide chain release factor 1 [Planctomycetota bacterium]
MTRDAAPGPTPPAEPWLAAARARAERFAELERLTQDPAVARDQARLPGLLREMGALADLAARWREVDAIEARRREAQALAADPAADPDLVALAREEMAESAPALERARERLKEALVGDDAEAGRDCIVEVRAGTGGEEAALFAADLYRMYSRYADGAGWKLELLDTSPTELGGLKEVVFALRGAGVYGAMRFEGGGHRVQRVPRTEAQGRIHTSACTVAVLPEIEAVEVDIKREDLVIETMRASGPGGQKVNKTESAIRLTHVPTGIVVHMQDNKSQHQNRDKAMRVLRARLHEHERQKAAAARARDRREQVGTGDRSDRVRTYNFPQNRVTDHRLNENYPLDQVIDGRLDKIIARLQEHDRLERLRALR